MSCETVQIFEPECTMPGLEGPEICELWKGSRISHIPAALMFILDGEAKLIEMAASTIGCFRPCVDATVRALNGKHHSYQGPIQDSRSCINKHMLSCQHQNYEDHGSPPDKTGSFSSSGVKDPPSRHDDYAAGRPKDASPHFKVQRGLDLILFGRRAVVDDVEP
ncbi:hypothetical protein ACJ73_05100 [Blastomyces percursus]|uniref:Uncharacterized protein n=1 Tax=Blastomyces percursus TaxID=1658174 RepID=A0A1J9Q4S5_9EURO|nr:hypothetical protein ACJ73_05100 [Blastomyces percursus]